MHTVYVLEMRSDRQTQAEPVAERRIALDLAGHRADNAGTPNPRAGGALKTEIEARRAGEYWGAQPGPKADLAIRSGRAAAAAAAKPIVIRAEPAVTGLAENARGEAKP